jgi:hypothetical protein
MDTNNAERASDNNEKVAESAQKDDSKKAEKEKVFIDPNTGQAISKSKFKELQKLEEKKKKEELKL